MKLNLLKLTALALLASSGVHSLEDDTPSLRGSVSVNTSGRPVRKATKAAGTASKDAADASGNTANRVAPGPAGKAADNAADTAGNAAKKIADKIVPEPPVMINTSGPVNKATETAGTASKRAADTSRNAANKAANTAGNTAKKVLPSPIGTSICTRSSDSDCYKAGRPACCSDDNYSCPSFMTMCDNFPEDWTGWNYCTQAPDYECYNKSKNGRPKCCSEPGGGVMNCPREQPPCDYDVFASSGVNGEHEIISEA